MDLARRLALAAAFATAVALTFAAAPAASKVREVGYRVEYSGSGMLSFREHRAVDGLTADEAIDLDFVFSGDLGVVRFRNGAPLDVRAGDRTEGLAGGEHTAWYQFADGSSVQGRCEVTPGADLATGATTFGEADPLLASLDGDLDLVLHPFDRLDVVMTCDGGETAAVGFDNLPLDRREPGSGRFDLRFSLPSDIVGMGRIEQLIPERTYTGDRCPMPDQGGTVLECTLTWKGKVTFRKRWQRSRPGRAKRRGGAPRAAASRAAAAGSLVHIRRGDIHLAAPDGSRSRRLTRDGGWAWPSQADGGRIVAVRQTREGGRTPRRLHVLRRDGRRVGRPIETVRVDDANFVGPLAPKVSPDGRTVAYHYFDTGISSDRSRTSVAFSRLSAGTEPGELGGHLGGYLTPSWLADGRVLVFYGAQRTSHVGLYEVGGDYLDWFGDPEVQTLLTDGEVSRVGDRLVAVGDANDLRFYELTGPPPAAPRLACVLTGFAGDVSEPTWSPDGRALAWAERDGVHVMALPRLDGCRAAKRPLVIRGATSPDWGPAPA